MFDDFFDISGGRPEIEEVKEENVKKTKLFDYINNISNDIQEIEVDSGYSPFIVNKGFMMYQDTLYIANALNRLNITDKDAHYEYLFYSVNKRKRFSKWAKEQKHDFEDLIEIIQNKFCYNRKHAIQMFYQLDDEDKTMLLNETKKGVQK